ncbi:MAG: putative inorganic carbon transporter subunit DabA, partial [Limnobacter sp.]
MNTHVKPQIETACAQACEAIAPAWPLDKSIAVNPHWSRVKMPVRRVAARMAVLGGIQVFPPRQYIRQAWDTGRIQPKDLDQAIQQIPDAKAFKLTTTEEFSVCCNLKRRSYCLRDWIEREVVYKNLGTRIRNIRTIFVSHTINEHFRNGREYSANLKWLRYEELLVTRIYNVIV